MGYDFLGTMGRDQWLRLKAFTETSVIDILGPEPTDGSERPTSKYLLNLQAEIKKAELGLVELDKAVSNFNNFKGDAAFVKEKEPPKPSLRFELADADTAQIVSYLKQFQFPQIKRKKDNLEYRVKKYLDLLDQLERRLLVLATIDERVTGWLDIVERHFSSAFHRHNLKRGETLNSQGYIEHTTPSVVVENQPEAEPYLDGSNT